MHTTVTKIVHYWQWLNYVTVLVSYTVILRAADDQPWGGQCRYSFRNASRTENQFVYNRSCYSCSDLQVYTYNRQINLAGRSMRLRVLFYFYSSVIFIATAKMFYLKSLSGKFLCKCKCLIAANEFTVFYLISRYIIQLK